MISPAKLFFYKPSKKKISLLTVIISAWYPSPADDFKQNRISIDQEIIKNKEATFYARVEGESMQGAGINNGDLLVIDKSIPPEDKKIAVCFIDGEFTVKRLKVKKDCILLIAENPKYKPIKVTSDNQLIIWGIVTYVIKKM